MEGISIETLSNTLEHVAIRTESLCISTTTTNSTNPECLLSASALSNHLVLEQIFRHFDIKSLLRLSLVNKSWCSTARSTLRTKRCLAYIKSSNPCRELLQLNESLSKSADAPYTGLSIRLTRTSSNHNCSKLDVSIAYSSLLNNMGHRHLEIHQEKESTCPAQSLWIKLLTDFGKTLKELKISTLPHQINSLEEFLGLKESIWLPTLKVLHVCADSMVKRSVRQELVQASPQLEKLLGFSSLEDLEFLLEQKKASKVRHFLFRYCFAWYAPEELRLQYKLNCINNFIKFADTSPKITKLALGDLDRYFYGNTRHLAEESFKLFLNSVSPFLEELRTDHFDLVLIMLQTSTPAMQKLERMELNFCNRTDSNFGFPTLERLDWGRSFPALKTVHISRRYSFSTILDIPGHLWDTAQFSPCLSVQEIVMVQELSNELYNSFDFDAMKHLSQLFPNVREFSISGVPSKLESLLQLLWSWTELETITLRSVKIKAAWYNKDSSFCGIDKKQVGNYIRESAETLEKLEFLPTKPSILSLKRLKNLRLEFIHPMRDINWNDSIPGILYPSRFFLSHVTGILAFSRMPQLNVVIMRETCSGRCRYNLDHLKPFVTMVDVDGKYVEQKCRY